MSLSIEYSLAQLTEHNDEKRWKLTISISNMCLSPAGYKLPLEMANNKTAEFSMGIRTNRSDITRSPVVVVDF